MSEPRLDRLEGILLTLLPVDGSKVPNGQLRPTWVQAAVAAGETVAETEFDAIRDRMVAGGLLVKGPGRGGATGRAASAAPGADDFELQKGEVACWSRRVWPGRCRWSTSTRPTASSTAAISSPLLASAR